jgi:hypothetical protein
MKKVCIIKPNEIRYSEFDNYMGKFTMDKIEEEIEDYVVQTIITDSSDFANKIITTLDAVDGAMTFTSNIYECNNYVYQMYHLTTYDGSNQEINAQVKSKKYNGIANILANYTYSIFSNALVAKFKINSDYTMTQEDLGINEFFDIFRKKKVYKGLLIKTNEEINEIEFVGDPLSWSDPKNKMNYRYYEFEVFGKVIMFFIQIKPENNNLNNFAIDLYGRSNLIRGDVFIALREKPNDYRLVHEMYSDINIKLINKLRELNIDENFDKNIQPGFYNHKEMKYENFYTLVDKIYSNYTKNENKKIINKNLNDIKSLNEITESLVNKK